MEHVILKRRRGGLLFSDKKPGAKLYAVFLDIKSFKISLIFFMFFKRMFSNIILFDKILEIGTKYAT